MSVRTDQTPHDRVVTLLASGGLGWVLDTSKAKEIALAHWLTCGASGGRLFVRVFDGAGNVRENFAGDVLASGITMQWNRPAKGWNAGAVDLSELVPGTSGLANWAGVDRLLTG